MPSRKVWAPSLIKVGQGDEAFGQGGKLIQEEKSFPALHKTMECLPTPRLLINLHLIDTYLHLNTILQFCRKRRLLNNTYRKPQAEPNVHDPTEACQAMVSLLLLLWRSQENMRKDSAYSSPFYLADISSCSVNREVFTFSFFLKATLLPRDAKSIPKLSNQARDSD